MTPVQNLIIENALKIGGWMSESELLFLAEQAGKSKNILEIGTYKGRSARALADNMDTDSHLTCIDPWDSGYQIFAEDKHKVFQNGTDVEFALFYGNLKKYITNKQLTFIRKTFAKAYSQIALNRYDFIFIDALHDYKSVIEDVRLASCILSKGGLLAGHDYGTWPSVSQAIDELFPSAQKVESIWYVKL